MSFQMFLLITLMTLAMSCLMSSGNMLLSEMSPQKEKMTSYECGFNPIYSPDKPFSMSFFLVGMLFLIFDLEMLFLMPWCYTTSSLNMSGQLWVNMFMMFLVLGLAYEWLKGGLEWC